MFIIKKLNDLYMKLLHKTLFATTLVGLLGVFFLSLTVQAQDDGYKAVMTLKDPKRAPEVWEKLVKNPTNMKIWVEYMGKNQSDWSMDEMKQVANWKQILMLRRLSEMESVGLVMKPSGAGFFIDDLAFEEMMVGIEAAKKAPAQTKSNTGGAPQDGLFIQKELGGVKAIIMNESKSIANLRKKPLENFAIIEDSFKQIFDQYGGKYTYYKEAFPDGKYNKITWIDDHEQRLKILKEKNLRAVYNSYKAD